jgi:hypothetical protein
MGTPGAEMTAAATVDLRVVRLDMSKAECLDNLMVEHSADSMVDARGNLRAHWMASQQVERKAHRWALCSAVHWVGAMVDSSVVAMVACLVVSTVCMLAAGLVLPLADCSVRSMGRLMVGNSDSQQVVHWAAPMECY